MDSCLIKVNGIEDIEIAGEIVKSDSKVVHIKILYGQVNFHAYYQKKSFDITFRMIRIGFQLQHNALKIMNDHSLFEILIDGPRFRLRKNLTQLEHEYSIW